MNPLLITRPNHDLGTNYLYNWSEHVIEIAKKKMVKVLDLKAKKANKKNMTSYILKNNPSLLFLNGHGSFTTIMGQKNEILLDKNTDERLVKDRIIYARSCSAGAVLGGILVNRGAKTFVGYIGSFILVMEKDKGFHPLEDQMAKRFLEPSNLIVTSILKGNSVGKAYQKSIKEMKEILDYFLSSDSNYEEKTSAPYMWNNISCQVLLGDENAKA
ncbi:hypothetical protein KKG65_02050 [Patescibacteria group bacterium]|nr:hypothetical protein [Patescibacteria group bacterium]